MYVITELKLELYELDVELYFFMYCIFTFNMFSFILVDFMPLIWFYIRKYRVVKGH